MGPERLSASGGLPALWRRPGWLRAPLLACVWAGLLVYGSLLPFGMDFSGAVREAGGVWPAVWAWATGPQWLASVAEASSLGVPNWVSDLLTNLIIYGPLGVLLRLTLSRVTGRQLVQVVSAVALVAGLSWSIEATQSLIPGRYASLQDVLANTAGGAAGVLLGHRVNALWRWFAFVLYRWTRGPMGAVTARLPEARGPWVMFVVAGVNALLIGAWWLTTRGAESAATTGSNSAVGLVPFNRHFDRSYDVAALLLGRSLIVYCLIGALLMLMLMRGTARRALGWVVLLVTLSAAASEAVKLLYPGVGHGVGADVTEPLLALIAGGLVLTLSFMLVHACRCSCRRQAQLPVEVERRARRHDYRFALGPDKRVEGVE